MSIARHIARIIVLKKRIRMFIFIKTKITPHEAAARMNSFAES
jgi:hypothetical protein